MPVSPMSRPSGGTPMFRIDLAKLVVAMEDALSVAVDSTTAHITEEAQRRAPVRKVFQAAGKRRRWPTGAMTESQMEIHRRVTFGPYSKKHLRQAYGLGTAMGDRSVGSMSIAAGASRTGRRRPSERFKPTLTLFSGEKRQGDWRRVHAVWSTKEGVYHFSMDAEAYGMLSTRGRYELHRALASVQYSEGRSTGHVVGNARGAISGLGSLTPATSLARGSGGEQLRLGGRLREGITQAKTVRVGGGIKGSVEALAIRPGNDGGANYAVFVEFGSGRGPAQPFLRPALVSAEHYLIAQVRRALHDSFKAPAG